MRPPGFEPGTTGLEGLNGVCFNRFRDDFLRYASGRYNPLTVKEMLSYLDRLLGDRLLRGPEDVIEIFSGLSGGQVHQLDRALRAFLNYCLLKGYSESWIRLLKKAIPKEPEFIDLKVPEEHEVVESLKKIGKVPLKYRALWMLCLESGIRLQEAINLMNNFDESKLAAVNGFYRYQIGEFRGFKSAYFAFFTNEALKLIQANGEKVIRANASHYYSKYKILQPKYLRKFAFNKMIELEVPESIADFIQGRVPKTVGMRHYAKLVKQADSYYGRYAEYLRELREKAGLQTCYEAS